MNWMDSVITGASEAASSVADAAGSVADAAGDSWWDTGVKYATEAFDWLDDTAVPWIEDNPNTAKLLSGVVGGVGSYMSAREARKAEEELLEKKYELERKASRIIPGSNGGSLGADSRSITKGLISHGLIARPHEKEGVR